MAAHYPASDSTRLPLDHGKRAASASSSRCPATHVQHNQVVYKSRVPGIRRTPTATPHRNTTTLSLKPVLTLSHTHMPDTAPLHCTDPLRHSQSQTLRPSGRHPLQPTPLTDVELVALHGFLCCPCPTTPALSQVVGLRPLDACVTITFPCLQSPALRSAIQARYAQAAACTASSSCTGKDELFEIGNAVREDDAVLEHQ